jgi:hypothetical protein
MRTSIQEAFGDDRTLEPRTRAARVEERNRPPQPSMRVMKPARVIVSIKDEDRGNGDLSLDVAAAVGRTVAKVVGQIEALGEARAELIQKLGRFRNSLGVRFRRWLPSSLSAAAREHHQSH